MPKEFTPEFITFSAKTSSNQTQDLIDAKLDKRQAEFKFIHFSNLSNFLSHNSIFAVLKLIKLFVSIIIILILHDTR